MNIRLPSILSFLPGISLVILIGLPLLGLPPQVEGIPVWYQDTFFLTLYALTGIGILALVTYWTKIFKKVHLNLLDGCVGILIIYSILRLALQEAVSQSAWIQLAFLTGLYFIGRILFTQLNRNMITWVTIGILLTGIGQAIYGLGQLYGYWPSHHASFPITGSFFNPGPYSGWLACVFPIGIWALTTNYVTKNKKIAFKVLGGLFLFLSIGVLIPAASRAAWLAVLVGSIIMVWNSIQKFFKQYKFTTKWIIPVIGIFIFGLLLWMYIFKKESADGRLLIWKVSTEMISDYPVFGTGWDRFPVLYNRYQAEYFNQGRNSGNELYIADYVDYPFNELLGWTVEMGIVGLILLAFICILLLREWFYQKRVGRISRTKILTLSVIISWFVFSIFSYPLEVPALAVIGVLSFSALVSVLYSVPQTYHTRTGSIISRYLQSSRLGSSVSMSILILSTIVYSIIWVSQYRQISKQWIIANANYQLGKYAMANEIFAAMWPYLKNERMYLQSTGKSFSMKREFFKSNQCLERALFYSSDPIVYTTLGQNYSLFGKVEPKKAEQAENMYTWAKLIQPGHYYPRYLLMELYERMNQEDKLHEEASDLLALETKVDSEAVKEIRNKAREVLRGSLLESDNQFKIIQKE